MRTVLLVTPHFPPTNAADMHRVRTSLPHFEEFGWRPVLLAVDPAHVEQGVDRQLLESIPPTVPTHHVRALPVQWTRKFGVGDLGLRALPFLYRGGNALIEKYPIDLIYFSTTVFTSMTLGRLWKRRYGIPYVLDMQDPWVGDYYEQRPRSERPPKYRLARQLHRWLEPWTMREVDGIIAVSAPYHETLRQRYPWIRQDQCRTIPFGASPRDFAIAAGQSRTSTAQNELIHGLSLGALGRPKKLVCEAACQAFRAGLERYPELFSKVRLKFVGTDYAPAERAAATIEPIARKLGLQKFITEQPARVAYFAGLKSLQDSDFLLLLGSDDPHYMPSKLYPHILARKPLLALLHENSVAAAMLQRLGAGEVATFANQENAGQIADALLVEWCKLLQRLPYMPAVDWPLFEPHTARETTRQQCELFDRVCAKNRLRQRLDTPARGSQPARPGGATIDS